MTLDPSAAALLEGLAALGGSELDGLTTAHAREAYAALSAAGAARHDPSVTREEELDLAGVPCLIVRPAATTGWQAASDPPARRPVLMWLHGGGWVIGSAEMTLTTARTIVAATGAVVVSVDYRLAPEHPFPAGLDDALAVARWLRGRATELGGDPDRIVVGGDSAGGNLAAVVAMEVPGLVAQVLVYPVTDATLSHPSIQENGEGKLLTARSMRWFVDHYLQGGRVGAATDPRVSPLLADLERLRGAPRAIVVTAGHDPLRDEGRSYAVRLRDAGVEVVEHHWPGQIHGFFAMDPIIPEGGAALAEVIGDLCAVWGAGAPRT